MKWRKGKALFTRRRLALTYLMCWLLGVFSRCWQTLHDLNRLCARELHQHQIIRNIKSGVCIFNVRTHFVLDCASQVGWGQRLQLSQTSPWPRPTRCFTVPVPSSTLRPWPWRSPHEVCATLLFLNSEWGTFPYVVFVVDLLLYKEGFNCWRLRSAVLSPVSVFILGFCIPVLH